MQKFSGDNGAKNISRPGMDGPVLSYIKEWRKKGSRVLIPKETEPQECTLTFFNKSLP